MQIHVLIPIPAPTSTGPDPPDSPQWEPTATKVPIPGKQGQLLTGKAQGGLATFMMMPKAEAMAAGPCSIKIAVTASRPAHSSWWAIAGSFLGE